jgi:hypothetical protein
VSKQIHLSPKQQTTYMADQADTTYILDKGEVFEPNGDGVNASFGVAGRDFRIAGTLKGDTPMLIGDLFTHKGGGDLTVLRSGSVLGSDYGITTYGTGQTIENAGHIDSKVEVGLSMQGDKGHLTNTGEITGNTVAADFMGIADAVTNSGQMVGGQTGLIFWTDREVLDNKGLISGGTNGIELGGNQSRVSNSGTITGTSSGIYATDYPGGEQHIIRNTGHITGTYAVACSDGQDIVRNSGSLTGIVDLGGGNDVFDGRGGVTTDEVRGGDGNDLYIVNHKTTIVEKPNEGRDTVKSSISFTLPENCDVLQLTGKANIHATGTTGFETLVGNRGNNVIDGLGGGDWLTGGAGADTFIYKTGYQSTIVLDDQMQGPSHDTIDLTGTNLHSFAEVMAHATNGVYGVTIDFGNGDQLLLDSLHKSDLHAGGFAFA